MFQAIDLRCQCTGQRQRRPPREAHDDDEAPQAPGAWGWSNCARLHSVPWSPLVLKSCIKT
jgi:hypothetical protein